MEILQKGLALVFLFIIPATFGATNTITTSQMIRDGETMVSSDGVFELGFFKTGKLTNQYVGLWYRNIKVRRVVWVANREAPLTGAGGVLKVIEPGLLVLLNDTNGAAVWSSKSSRSVQNPIAQLLDSGNLVVRDANDERPENFLWQSFDHPTDTSIPGMKIGMNYVTGIETYLTSWKSNDDPALGDFSTHVDPTGYPQVLLKNGTEIWSRVGPWNGFGFSGGPNETGEATYKIHLVMNEKEVYVFQEIIDKSVTIALVDESGYQQRWTWVDGAQNWVKFTYLPIDSCDQYKLCGAYGKCSTNTPFCRCLDRFVPKDQEGWARSDRSNGCVRRNNLSCQGDIFLKYPGIKLPDSRNSRYIEILALEDCKAECLKDCSCMACTQLDRSKGTGCLLWLGDLIDMKDQPENGDDIYIRMSSSEAENVAGSEGKKKYVTVAVSLTSVLVIILIGTGLFLYIRKRLSYQNLRMKGQHFGSHEQNSELPLFDLSTILEATDRFSINNKLGEGGFGPVYKGMLEGGQEIAVKRLSKDSMQGLDEFKNEIIFIAKLQHRNLVRLIGGCINGEEKMLIYEYMPNKSLDMILFDQTKSMLLDWKKRFSVINGIARGLLYLHQDSQLRVIHRDLKPSNVLLDSDMNPKISDFGMARSFRENETEAKTRRVVGTYGYMSPEYAIDGMFSTKSDVFSFGVLVIEIVSGMRNRGFSHDYDNLNLIGHAWTLYKEGRSQELVDPCLAEPFYISEMLRIIHVGLLCVQKRPEDRPSMFTVVFMLSNEVVLPDAKQPGFFTEREVTIAQSSTSTNTANSANEITITMIEAR
ncbi:G-type lectin S-receptor-like serine/threonine-protein kinase At4g27290 isoform X1 [Primulina huaijiensis]|uniref:G-type lectin S-receptor-like serine/threonine-protein kinase At4g27290 isoform X1 n=2 Tax=Primulina huaijiensis TaxID=1492673 RepID=UPI003CC70765